MSITPSVPDFKAGLTSFWKKPEGKLGAFVMLVAIVACVYGGVLFLPAAVAWAVAFATDFLHLFYLGIALFVSVAVVANKTFRSVVSNMFQMSMRWMANLAIETDPIGMLKNTIDRMRATNARFQKAVSGCSGAKQSVKAQMDSNVDAVRHATSLKEQAEKALARERDPLAQKRFGLSKEMQLQEIGRKMKSNEKLGKIYAEVSKLYDMLCGIQQLVEFNIDNTQATITNAEQERKVIVAAYRGMSLARKLIQGEPEQLKMYNATLQYLADDNASKLGEMNDFARWSEKYITNMNLEQGASAADAEKMLAEFERKLLPSGEPAVQDAAAVPDAEQNNYWKR